MATWDAFLKDMGREFSTAYSKADERYAEKEEERKKLRAKVAKLENAIKSASGEEIELATGIKPSEGEAMPKGRGVVARDVISPADQIFKKLKNKNLMERFAALEAVADRLPEARTELRAVRREERFDEKVEKAESDKIMKESFDDYATFEKEEKAKKDASDRWIMDQHERFLTKQETDKEADAQKLSEMVGKYESLVPEFEKEEAIGLDYDRTFSPTAVHSKAFPAIKEAAPYSDWAKPSMKKAFLRNPRASSIIDAANLYTELAGVPPDTSYALSPRFLADMSRKEKEKASGEAAEKALVLDKAAAGAMLGKPIPDSLPPADRRIVEGKVSLLKMQQEISIQEEEAAATRRLERGEREVDIVETRAYKKLHLPIAVEKSKSLSPEGLPKWAIVPEGQGKDKRWRLSILPTANLTPSEAADMNAAYDKWSLKPKTKEGAPDNPLNLNLND